MRRISSVVLMVFLASFAWGQQTYREVVIQPYVSCARIASVISNGTDTLATAAKAFGSIVVGQPVYGPGIPAGTVVESLPNPALDSLIIISNAATTTRTQALNFGYYLISTYATGDNLGLPFKLWSGERSRKLISVTMIDSVDKADDFDILFFYQFSDSLGADSTAVALPEDVAQRLVGSVSVTANLDWGDIRTVQVNNVQMVLPGGEIWARLVARSAFGILGAVRPFVIRLGFEE